MKNFEHPDYVHTQDIPNIDLYMDQVLTFLNSQFESHKRTDEEKSLTKAMINNYSKNHVLPAPDKKKYSRDHVLAIIFIYYFKSFLSIKDIQEILTPLTENFFSEIKSDVDLFEVYSQVVDTNRSQMGTLKNDIFEKFMKSRESFEGASADEQEYLQNLTFLCLLGMDVYFKKMLIEKLIDSDFLGTKEEEKKD